MQGDFQKTLLILKKKQIGYNQHYSRNGCTEKLNLELTSVVEGSIYCLLVKKIFVMFIYCKKLFYFLAISACPRCFLDSTI